MMTKLLGPVSLLGALLAAATPAVADLNATVYADWQRGGVVRGESGDITFDGLTELGSFVDSNLDHWDGTPGYRWIPLGRDDYYSVRWTGYLDVSAAGEYGFRSTSDDGIQVFLGGALVISSPVVQHFGTALGTAVLAAGATPIEVRFYENEGNDGIRLEWMQPGETEWSVIPAAALAPVPEPATSTLALAGLIVVLSAVRRRRARVE
jgi:hypothetical protein